MKRYIFYIDIDGTLISNSNNEISKSLIEKIVTLRKNGNIFVITTGRAYNSAILIKGLEYFDYISASFGNFVMDLQNKKVVYKGESISENTIKKLLPFISGENCYWCYKTGTDEKTIFKQISEKYPHIRFVSKEEFNNDIYNGIYQFIYYGYFSDEIKNKLTEFNFYDMPDNYTDIVLKTASKENIIKYFKNSLPEYISVAIGDSCNDLPMLKKADISIAMGNSNDDVKETAQFKTLTVEEDGVLYALNNILKL